MLASATDGFIPPPLLIELERFNGRAEGKRLILFYFTTYFTQQYNPYKYNESALFWGCLLSYLLSSSV